MGTEHTLITIVLANFAVLAGSLVQTTMGMGFAMVAAPLLALISLQWVPGPMLLINLILSLLMLGKDRSNIERNELKLLLPMITLGTVLAALILANLSTELFGVVFGLMILVAVAVSIFIKNVVLSSTSLATGGLIAGLMGTIAGISGPPMAVLYQHEELQKSRPTLALVFSFSYISSLVALAWSGSFNLMLAFDGLKLLPGLLLGYVLAIRYRGWVSQRIGRISMLSLATVSSIFLIVNSLN